MSAQIGAAEFERQYLTTYTEDPRLLPDDVFNILDRLFFDCDAFCPDAALRTASDLEEGQLLEACKLAYQKLHSLQSLTAQS